MTVVGLFAGVGGFELGFERAGLTSELLCEIDPAAQAVLAARFDAAVVADVRDLRSLPADASIVAAGFPCTDISQAGRTAGIFGEQSGLVSEVFRLIRRRYPDWLIIENVQNLLVLRGGDGIRHIVEELEAMKMRWAYRVVDSRFSGVPQRRRRVLLVASRLYDPRDVLLSDDVGARPDTDYGDSAYGFYWTEGLRGLGWAIDAVPTLKGGSTIGIPSPPGIWNPVARPGRRLVTPAIEDAERLQGFPAGWTAAFDGHRALGRRWKMVGNAVTVGVAQWLGERLVEPRAFDRSSSVPLAGPSWPTAAWGDSTGRYSVLLSEFPRHDDYRHLDDVVELDTAPAISHRGAAGFLSRTQRAKLRFDPDFIADVAEHVHMTDPANGLAAAG